MEVCIDKCHLSLLEVIMQGKLLKCTETMFPEFVANPHARKIIKMY